MLDLTKTLPAVYTDMGAWSVLLSCPWELDEFCCVALEPPQADGGM